MVWLVHAIPGIQAVAVLMDLAHASCARTMSDILESSLKSHLIVVGIHHPTNLTDGSNEPTTIAAMAPRRSGRSSTHSEWQKKLKEAAARKRSVVRVIQSRLTKAGASILGLLVKRATDEERDRTPEPTIALKR